MTHRLKHIGAIHRAMEVLVIAYLISLLLVSCRKHTDPLPTKDTAYRTTDKTLLNRFPPQQQRLIYNLLTGTEKSDLWAYHLQDGIVQIGANKAQRQFIESLMPKLTASFFNRSLTDDVMYSIAKLSQEVAGLFTKDEYAYLFFTLDSSYKTFLAHYHKEVDDGLESDKNCKCSTKSDFCSGVLRCSLADCFTTSMGCGFMLLFSCNGLCS